MLTPVGQRPNSMYVPMYVNSHVKHLLVMIKKIHVCAEKAAVLVIGCSWIKALGTLKIS